VIILEKLTPKIQQQKFRKMRDEQTLVVERT
jgi:hypothetical protein